VFAKCGPAADLARVAVVVTRRNQRSLTTRESFFFSGVNGEAGRSLRELRRRDEGVVRRRLLPVGLYRLNWFYPAMMILLGAHYLPFVFLYGMRMFAVLAAFLVGGGTLIAMYFSASFSAGARYTGTVLLVFAELGRRIVNHEYRVNTYAHS
jgi:hypothetical protein